MKNLYAFFLAVLLSGSLSLQAQVPTCSPDVPFYYVNLTGQPAGSWESPGHSRQGNCCGTTSPDRCTSFEVVLDSQAAMISFNIASGAVPPGALYYQINCGPQIPVGQPICISGVGPHHVTFCKPGNNQNTYILTSIPRPIFPPDATVRLGCSKELKTLGMEATSVTWTSVYPGTQGQYDSYLSCTSGCPAPIYTPTAGAPPYIDYKICGFPIADECGFVAVCDTVRVYNISALSASVSPNPAQFCSGGGGVLLTATAVGGDSNYTYKWKDQNGNTISTNPTYQATSAGIYTMEARDGLYDPAMCPSVSLNVPVVVGQPPIINAGPDQKLCASSPIAHISATVQNATGGTWSGGNGTYNTDNTGLILEYVPTVAEVNSGSVTLTLTSTGAGGGCVNASDAITLFYPPLLSVTLGSKSLLCNNAVTTLTPVVAGGITPYSFNWSNASVSSSITAGEGNYCVNVTDSMGCPASACANITVPNALTLTMSSVDVTTNGGSDGSATANPGGGTPPYSYLWSPGNQTTQTATGLSYGIYSATVTDANGCSINLSTVVNEPRCLGFQVITSGTNVSCNGDLTGTASASVSGGTTPYTYSWNTSPAQTTSSISGLGAGIYMATVMEANGCVDVSNVVINQPTKLTNTMNHTNVSVVSGTDGTATTNVFGGTAPYTYLWDNGKTSSSISNLTAGIYSIAIQDNNGCSLYDSVQVYDPECSRIIMNVYSTNVSCSGGSDGTASAQILFGITPYHYQWSNGATSATITGLSAGVYSVVGWGALQCTHFANVIITEPSPLDLGLAPTNISCSSLNNGSIDLTVTGGTFPYNFNWSNGITVEDQNQLSNGNYSVIVTDAHGCTANANTAITRPNTITSGSTKTNVTCNAGSNGSVDVSISGGVLPYSYSWSNGRSTEDISGLTAGQYILVATDANGCTPSSSLSVLIDEPEKVTNTFIVNCPVPGSGVSEVNATPTGGNGPYQISFDNGTSYLSSGNYNKFIAVDSTYHVIVKDENSCLSALDTLIINPQVIIPTISFAKCFSTGASSTPVLITPAGGVAGLYQVSFDNGSSYTNPGNYSKNLPIASSYGIIVKDSLGCASAVSSITIPDTLSLNAVPSSYAGGNNISCNGLTDGSINLSVSGGTAFYNYLWNNNSTTEDLSGISAGSYSVIVSDMNGCSKSLNINLNQPAVLVGNPVVTTNFSGYDVSCNGSSNANIDLTVNGGTALYSYSWSNGASTEDLNSVGAGTYSVTIRDANGCITTSSISITEPAVLMLSSTNTNVSCDGFFNGSIDLTTNGGVSSYSYVWSNGNTTEDVNGLSAGYYSVTVTDANSCTTTTSVIITEPPVLSAVTSSTEVLCNGGNSGTANVTPAGGTIPYTYLWNNGQTAATANQLSAGTYNITVTDANGCTINASSTVNQPSLLSSVVMINSNVKCNGGSDGNATVIPSGGKAPYTYLWSNGNTASSENGLSAGNYNVTVIDANSCSFTNTLTISEPEVLAISNSNASVSCFNGSDGIISVNVNGGTLPYVYVWNNGQTTATATNLTAGTYTVNVTDFNGCSSALTTTISQPTLLAASTSQINVSCNGLSDASTSVTVSGGTLPYNYQWSNNSTTTNITGLSAGNYSVIVTDNKGCTANSSVIITQPAVLSSAVTGTNVSCYSGNNGTATLTASGGTTPYSYSWTDGQTTTTASQLSAGTYNVIITDKNSCSASASITINQPAILLAATATTNVLCNSGNNGSATISVSGGTIPYSYLWNNGQTTTTANQLTAGTYNVIVTDKNNCSASANVTINQPAALSATTSVINVLCNGGNNGGATISANGGTAPYFYQWNNGQTTATATNLSAGIYSVTVTDANSCIYTTALTVTEPLVLTLTSSSVSASCNKGNNGTASVSANGGTPPYIYQWNNSQTTSTATGLPAGTYTVVVTDSHGCNQSAMVSVSEKSPVQLSFNNTNVTCNGEKNGLVIMTVNGGVMPYTYQWSTGETTKDISNLSAGVYIINVVDANQCTKTDTVLITQPTPLYAEITSSVFPTGYNISQYHGTDGNLTLTVWGGTIPYQYNWSNGSTTKDIKNLNAGNYYVLIIDNNGCTYNTSVMLTEPYDLAMPNAISPNGDGKNDYFLVHGLDIYPNNKIQIFNRWGDVVYARENYLDQWNGQNQGGNSLPDGTYFVILEVKMGDETRTLTGFVDVRK